ncbi:MAG: carbohydrate kinase family protein [Haloglomus sp.]
MDPGENIDSGILVAGETLVDFLPDREGDLAAVERFTRRAGGAPANVAVGLARLDRTPWFWTRVGADPFGEFLAATLTEEGLPDRFVERDPDARTTLAFVARDGEENSFTFYRDGTADTRLEAGSVPDATLADVEWVYVGGVMLASDPGRSATRSLVGRANEHDCTVVFDPNARPELWTPGEFERLVGDVLADVGVVKATPDDLRAAGFEGEVEALADAVLDAGPHTVLLTMGAEGSFARSAAAAPGGAATATHAGYPVDPVDTTGAGDAFTAGALATLADGERDLETVLGFANAVAAVTTTATGAMTALPDRAAVREFRRERRA